MFTLRTVTSFPIFNEVTTINSTSKLQLLLNYNLILILNENHIKIFNNLRMKCFKTFSNEAIVGM